MPARPRHEPAGDHPEALVRAAYERLHEIAHRRMRAERPGRLLQTTALVHEAYLRLLKEDPHAWTPRQFLGAAAEAMRRILIEQARASRRLRRGGARQRIPLRQAADAALAFQTPALEIPALDEAVERLRRVDPRMHEVVMLRFFAGLEIDQVASLMGLSARTVDREWRCARVWLYEAIEGQAPPPRRSARLE